MATVEAQVAQMGGLAFFFQYDDATLVVSAVRIANPTGNPVEIACGSGARQLSATISPGDTLVAIPPPQQPTLPSANFRGLAFPWRVAVNE